MAIKTDISVHFYQKPAKSSIKRHLGREYEVLRSTGQVVQAPTAYDTPEDNASSPQFRTHNHVETEQVPPPLSP